MGKLKADRFFSHNLPLTSSSKALEIATFYQIGPRLGLIFATPRPFLELNPSPTASTGSVAPLTPAQTSGHNTLYCR